MSAAYDSYDYQDYWTEREYEHESEVVCVRAFLNKIPKIDKIIEIGAGFGRMAPYYSYRARKVILTDPSAREMSQAKGLLSKFKNVEFVQSKLETLKNKFRRNTFDLAIMIRVMHHIDDPEQAIAEIERLITPGGYLIIEFANKIHFKSLVKNLLKGDITYAMDTSPEDKRSMKTKKRKTLPFLNYHPDTIINLLEKMDFKILDKRSVSNIRSPFLKKYLPISLLVSIESLLQKPLSLAYFGPSIFLLARKKG